LTQKTSIYDLTTTTELLHVWDLRRVK